MRRAAHQLLDRPLVLDDPAAMPMLDREAAARLRADPPSSSRFVFRALSERVASAGEPFASWFDREELTSELRSRGFASVVDMPSSEINARYFAGRMDGLEVWSRTPDVGRRRDTVMPDRHPVLEEAQ